MTKKQTNDAAIANEQKHAATTQFVTLPVFLNRTQLARKLGIAAKTLAVRISLGVLAPDALDGKGRELFREKAVK